MNEKLFLAGRPKHGRSKNLFELFSLLLSSFGIRREVSSSKKGEKFNQAKRESGKL